MPLLRRGDIDVRVVLLLIGRIKHCNIIIQLVVWPEDRACDRSWLMDQVPGASGIVVMLSDAVS